ncbi:metallothionein-47 [Zygosaccharomyces parabailii]|nr:hypothetical protein BZL39_B04385 [Zygosaccharomyces parabailii]AQZ10516.1 hypothetical protein BZL39_B04395 [Zygosaccharomyces parabailii]AQZ14199.1 metallothionein-47 [Zygosaccharomyces parabailii]AQZ14201.1 metallothionein-47 [Zygosaccharomyces parabailii]AQZ14203.1 metallothionein-47 [Zygosaccharomyces parabailii]
MLGEIVNYGCECKGACPCEGKCQSTDHSCCGEKCGCTCKSCGGSCSK